MEQGVQLKIGQMTQSGIGQESVLGQVVGE